MANSILESQKAGNIIGITGIIIGLIVSSVWGYIQYKQNNETKIISVKEKSEVSTNLVEKKNTFFPTNNKSNLSDTNKTDKDKNIEPQKEQTNTALLNSSDTQKLNNTLISENTKTNNIQVDNEENGSTEKKQVSIVSHLEVKSKANLPKFVTGTYKIKVKQGTIEDNYLMNVVLDRDEFTGTLSKIVSGNTIVVTSIHGSFYQDSFRKSILKFDEEKIKENNDTDRYILKRFNFELLDSDVATGKWQGAKPDIDHLGSATIELR